MSQGLTTSERLGRTCAWRWRSLALPSEFESVEPSSRLPPLRSRIPLTRRGDRQSPRMAESYGLGGTHHLVQGHVRPSLGTDRLQQVLERPFRRSRVERFILFRSKATREAATQHNSASVGMTAQTGRATLTTWEPDDRGKGCYRSGREDRLCGNKLDRDGHQRFQVQRRTFRF
jgi:hypothetical protein